MKNFIIALNDFYNKYKMVIFSVIVIVVLYLLVLGAMKKEQNKNNNSSSVNRTTTIVANYTDANNVNQANSSNNPNNSQTTKISSNEDAITTFIKLCGVSNYDQAYNMLSDDCKNILYPTKEAFINNYCKNKFKNSKDAKFMQYGQSGTYRVDFLLDNLAAGTSKTGTVESDYITVTSSRKLNLSGFIKKEQVNKSAENQQLQISIKNRYVFMDHEEYDVIAQNFIKADIYFDDVEQMGNTFIVDSNNAFYKLNLADYTESDLQIPANSTKETRLRFEKSYGTGNEISKISFNNIVIHNFEYYVDNTSSDDGSQGQTGYTKYKTTYPEKVSLNISIK